MKKGVVVLEIIAIIALIGCAAFLGMKVKECMDVAAEGNKYEDTKIVLYDGPTSLKDATAEDIKRASETEREMDLMHCTDTKVSVNGYDCYVYDTNVNDCRKWYSNYYPSQTRTPVTYFEFEGVVEITVTVPDIELESATVSPLSYGIEPIIDTENHTVTFTVDKTDNYTVQFNGDNKRALHIFTYDIETDIPSADDENVIYFGPGEWEIDDLMVTEDGTTVYISGGAVIHGTINCNFVNNVTVCGRGIIDGSTYKTWGGTTARVPLNFNNCDGTTLEDVIILNPNAWCVQQYTCTNGVIDGLNIISSRPNGDGISLQSCTDYKVENCFLRTWDDNLVVKNYSDVSSKDIIFSNCQLWTDLAQSMEIGYETNKGCYDNMTISDITFENITVLHNYHKPVISIHNADDAAISNITFSNITIEHNTVGVGDSDIPYLIDLHVGQSGNWSSTKERGTISDVLIENVNVLSGSNTDIRVAGISEDKNISNITFKNINMNGTVLTSAEDSNFKLVNYAENIVVEADDDFIAAAADLAAKYADSEASVEDTEAAE